MKASTILLRHLAVWTLVLQMSGLALFAQPILIQPNGPFGQRPVIGMGVENLRVVEQSADGTEALLTMDYSYDGFAGTTAKIVPMIGKKGQRGVSGWFGSDPVTIGRGSGTISIKVKYFNDEPGVPPEFTSDQVQVFILNRSGTARLFAVPFLKKIKWGHPATKPAVPANAPVLSVMTAEQAKKLAAEKSVAEERARAEAEAREKARVQAEAEAKARQEAEKRALAEAIIREEAQRKAEEEAKRIAAELKQAEEKRLAEAREREEARKAAEALEKKRAEEKRRAEQRARQEAEAQEKVRLAAEAKAREEARLNAEIEAKRLAEERRIAEERARAESLAQEEATRKAEAEAKRLADEQRIAQEKALAETRARKEAEEKAWEEALAQAKAELEAKQFAAEKKQAEVIAQSAAAAAGTSMDIASGMKTRVTNVDVVNRSIDRTQMTFGVEFEYRDKLADPLLGVDVLRHAQPDVSRFFASRPAEIGRSRRNFVLLPVKFQPADGMVDSRGFSTDKVLVYLQEKKSARRYNIFPATMLLLWSAPGGRIVSAQSSGNTVEIDDFKQNDASSGYISVKYALLEGRGRLRAKVYAADKPESAAYFETQLRDVQAGRGLQLIDVRLLAESTSPTEVVPADTIEVELLDSNGTVLARVTKEAAMVWARPK